MIYFPYLRMASAVLLVLLGGLVALGVGQTTIDPDDPAFDLAFPDGFIFSTATASYQVEGGWNASGKGENIWDRTTHEHPELILDGSNGDVSSDSYHKFKEDVMSAKSLGTKMYRFSLSWARLLPTGAIDHVNPDGVRYYNALIDECLANGIEPMVTIFHWDLPQSLQDIGGLPNEELIEYFVDYADFVFKTFGDRVKWWITYNEAWTMCVHGYGLGLRAPAIQAPARADYLCGHTSLKMHARTYHLYREKYFATQGGKLGLNTVSDYFYPKDPNNPDDVAAAERWQQMNHGWFLHPVHSKEGDYPPVFKKFVQDASAKDGLKRSRLPEFTKEEVEYIRGTADFLGLNVYTSSLVAYTPTAASDRQPLTREKDAAVTVTQDPAWESTIADWLKVEPKGMRNLLNWIKREYGDWPVFITENGYADGGELVDEGRIRYYRSYLLEMLKAIHHDGCNVIGHTAWSLVDNFEWFYGYKHKFGLFHVDFNDPERPRTPKKSAEFYKKLIATRKVPREGEISYAYAAETSVTK